MGVTNIRYLLNQWRLRWEALAAVHSLERESPESIRARLAPPKDPGEKETGRRLGSPGK